MATGLVAENGETGRRSTAGDPQDASPRARRRPLVVLLRRLRLTAQAGAHTAPARQAPSSPAFQNAQSVSHCPACPAGHGARSCGRDAANSPRASLDATSVRAEGLRRAVKSPSPFVTGYEKTPLQGGCSFPTSTPPRPPAPQPGCPAPGSAQPPALPTSPLCPPPASALASPCRLPKPQPSHSHSPLTAGTATARCVVGLASVWDSVCTTVPDGSLPRHEEKRGEKRAGLHWTQGRASQSGSPARREGLGAFSDKGPIQGPPPAVPVPGGCTYPRSPGCPGVALRAASRGAVDRQATSAGLWAP